jgi:beta-galactosidase
MPHPIPRWLQVTVFFFAVLTSAFAARKVETLSTGWRFTKGAQALDADTSAWSHVTVPHCWNALDGQDRDRNLYKNDATNVWTPGEGEDPKADAPRIKEDYYRGPAWYARDLPAPDSWRGRRVFLRFEAASSVAKVWLNGHALGEHAGAFTAFCFELTPHLRFGASNSLRVEVNNAFRADVSPISGDFTVAGGLYRPVHLLVTDAVNISPLDFATSGLYLTQKSLTESLATVEARAVLSNSSATARNIELRAEVRDAAGLSVASARITVTLPAVTASQSATVPLSIPRPRRWHGTADPHLYQVTVSISHDGTVVDRVAQPLGLRDFAITEEKGFLLNGRSYPLHGVNRHQDWRDLGWALTDSHHERDFAFMTELGANAVRLAHYPQSEKVYDLADRLGLVLWHEIPLVDATKPTLEFRANAVLQLREMMWQHYNHPSVAFTGLFNEIRRHFAADALPLIKELREVARSIAPDAILVAAPNILGQEINRVPDRLGYNVYPGWYYGDPAIITTHIESRWKDAGQRRIALSEYGAGGNPDQHEEGVPVMPKHRSHWHPEEWQTFVHEENWRRIQDNPKLWGSFVWVMFDFASDARNEGAKPGVNDKGLMTQDRAVKKDAFYFYQANWTTAPMVHLTGKRLATRRLGEFEIKAYTTCTEAELFLNGKSLGRAKPDAIHIVRWPGVKLSPGPNTVSVVARSGFRKVRDTCTWTYTPASAPSLPSP